MRVILLLGMLWAGAGVRAENWPAWRGPHSNGVVPDREGPANFAAERMWKVKLEGRACSTPVVWEGKVFVTGLIGEKDAVQAFDLKSGKELWRKELGAARLGRTQRIGSSANSSPLTDGRHLFVYFKSGTVAALTLQGKVAWKINLDEVAHPDKILWDRGTSPIFAGGHLVIAVMQQAGISYLVALDKKNGKRVWITERSFRTVGENGDSYSSPFVATVGGVETIVTWGGDHLTGHEARTGKQLWFCGGFNPKPERVWRTIASPSGTNEVAIVPHGREDRVAGIKLGGKGDITKSAWLWSARGWGSDNCTPAAHGKRALMLTDTGKARGTLTMVEAGTGKKLWQESLPKSVHTFCASPVVAGNRLYVARRDGAVFTARLTAEGIEGLEEINIGEGVIASPVVVDDKVLIRGDRHLVCLW
ncbi:MAG: PQQ-binding-like beta-propeller repeat protein [Verrucomicrobiota bacterium]|nr:PQQ-binding-like beta-propeller repeat protein [Verrucomicrobiota bacterium]